MNADDSPSSILLGTFLDLRGTLIKSWIDFVPSGGQSTTRSLTDSRAKLIATKAANVQRAAAQKKYYRKKHEGQIESSDSSSSPS